MAAARPTPSALLMTGRSLAIVRTMTHDYKRNGTTTLFAALNILDDTENGSKTFSAISRDIPVSGFGFSPRISVPGA